MTLYCNNCGNTHDWYYDENGDRCCEDCDEYMMVYRNYAKGLFLRKHGWVSK